MSLIGLALAIASIVLAFRRDFKEAAGVFAVGIVAVLLATPAGLSLLRRHGHARCSGRRGTTMRVREMAMHVHEVAMRLPQVRIRASETGGRS